jgi:hypothetical protein
MNKCYRIAGSLMYLREYMSAGLCILIRASLPSERPMKGACEAISNLDKNLQIL